MDSKSKQSANLLLNMYILLKKINKSHETRNCGVIGGDEVV